MFSDSRPAFVRFRFYAKRCMLSLIENMTKHIIVMRDSFYNECLVFLNQCECKSDILFLFATLRELLRN